MYALGTPFFGIDPGVTDWRVQLFDSAGASVGGPVSTGFVERGNGFYYWYYAAYADGFVGGGDVYRQSDPTVIVSSFAVNPQEVETKAQVVAALATDTYAELASVPSATSSLKDKITWLFMLARNKMLQTSSVGTLRNDADSATVATSAVNDDGATFTRGEWS